MIQISQTHPDEVALIVNNEERGPFVLTPEAIQQFQKETQKKIDADPGRYQNPFTLHLDKDFEEFLKTHYSDTIENMRCLIYYELVITMYYFPCKHLHKLCGQCYQGIVNYCDNDDCDDSKCHPSSIKCPECRHEIMVPKGNRESTLMPDLRFNNLVKDWLRTVKQHYYQAKILT